ncbi:MAG: PilZ domain-containing protein [Candidatus Xenobium sp.]|jgi:hypothetical protein|nr:PilZ domain-containing protein [Burkholderiales bacterium]
MNQPSASGAERREHFRAPWPINKTLQCELYLQPGDPEIFYLHVVDLSLGGMGINSHRDLPRETEFRLKLPLEGFGIQAEVLDFRCRVAWRKYLLGGTWNHGLQFTTMEQEHRLTIEKILERFSGDGRLKSYRFNRVLPVALREKTEGPWMGERYASNLTLEAVELRLEHPLDEGLVLQVRLALEFGMPSLHLPARVTHCQELPGSRYQVKMQFQDLTPEQDKTLRTYLERCMKAR